MIYKSGNWDFVFAHSLLREKRVVSYFELVRFQKRKVPRSHQCGSVPWAYYRSVFDSF